ncbi:YybH family protein [Halorarius litoreus]|uniref:YybH family protein n=1 Tax=Halorarius litoreus TaxID=2962676 RepID=UPI0020CB77A9|nr:nuclear transport factor 2 family protein [Halorarius litoreus]
MSTGRVTTEDEVRAASDRFYDALERMANGDAGPMMEVWSHADDVTTMHPIGGREVGWAEVEGPWGAVAELAGDGTITRADQLVRVVGDCAYELTTEKVSFTLAGERVDTEVRATNVYRREDGEWKIVHHHADPSPEMLDVMAGLDAGA